MLEKLKFSDLLKDKVVIVTSCIYNDRFEKELFYNGASYFFVKPYDENVMAERIEKIKAWNNAENTYTSGDIDVLNCYFGYTIQSFRGKPTNSEFIAMISDKLRIEMNDMDMTV